MRLISVIFFSAAVAIAACLNNGLGLTPPMGWNSWNKFACNVNETVIRQTADTFISLGLDKLGYNYVNIDDCWSQGRDPVTNRILPDPKTFPSGIKALSDYIHGLGLKIGIYGDSGTATCEGRPGSIFTEDLDAQTFADWEIDLLKFDNCNNLDLPPKWRYPRMRDALNKTGRAIFYSLCQWGVEDPAYWADAVGNSWRTTGDINAHWASVVEIINLQARIANFSAPGGWNDPDMLEVGNGNLTATEGQSHFSIWAILKSPLILGNDLSAMTNETLAIVTNPEVIAINQDPLGISGTRVNSENNVDIWSGPLIDGLAVVVLNKNDVAVNYTLALGLAGYHGSAAQIRDLVARQDLGVVSGSLSFELPAHGSRTFKLSRPNSNLNENQASFLTLW